MAHYSLGSAVSSFELAIISNHQIHLEFMVSKPTVLNISRLQPFAAAMVEYG
jgi:hypothetical protein